MLDRDLGPTGRTELDVILLATREMKIVVDKIPLSDQYDIEPEDFLPRRYPHWGQLRRKDGRETFLLTERSFTSAIDGVFGNLPSRLIRFYLNRAHDGPVTVLDLGGGRDAKTASQIASQYPDTQVMNIDWVAINETRGNLISRQGDVCNLTLANRSVDFVYSHQVLPHMDNQGNFKKPTKAVEEGVRVLRPGGSAIIDFTDDSYIPGSVLRNIEQRVEGLVMIKEKSYGGVFLFIVRNPVDPAIVNLLVL